MRILALLALCAGTAAAQAPDPLAQGKEQFAFGQREFNLGNYDRAAELWESAYRLTAKAELLYNVAYVRHKLFLRSRRLDHLQQSVDRYRAFLEASRDGEARITALRAKAAGELKVAEDELAREQAARAKGEEALALGEELVRQGKIAEAADQATRYQRTPGNERPGLVRAYGLWAAIAMAMGDAAGAEEAWLRALSLDRAAAPAPSAPEPLKQAHARARARLGDAPALSVAHLPAATVRPGAPVELGFQVASDPVKLAKTLLLHYRASGEGAFSTLRAPVGRVALPRPFTAALAPGAKVQYYAEVLDPDEAVLEHLGSSADPFTLAVAGGEPGPRRAWIVVAVGAVVAIAAASVGVGLYLTRGPQGPTVPIQLGLLHW